jgi:hypothetical protein
MQKRDVFVNVTSGSKAAIERTRMKNLLDDLPLIRSDKFTLSDCTNTIRAELLWILQEQDSRNYGITIFRIRNP